MRSKHSDVKAFGFMLLSTSLLAVAALLSKMGVTTLELPVVILLQYALPLLIVIPFFLHAKEKLFGVPLTMHIMRAFFTVVGMYSFFFCLLHSTMMDAVLLYNTTPLFVPVLARVLLKKPVSRNAIVSSLLGFVGLLIYLAPDKGILEISSLVGVASGFFGACSQLCLYKTTGNSTVLHSLMLRYLFGSVLCGVVVMLVPATQLTVLDTTSLPMVMAIFALLAAVNLAAQRYRFLAFKASHNPAELTPLFYVSVAFAGLLDWAYFHAIPNWHEVAGSCIVLASALLTMPKPRVIKLNLFKNSIKRLLVRGRATAKPAATYQGQR